MKTTALIETNDVAAIRQQEQVPVTIQQLKEVDKELIPKRFKKYLLIGCAKGNLTLQVDEKEIKVGPREVLTITSGQYHYFKDTENAEGYLLDFTLDFFCKSDVDIEHIFRNGLFCHFDLNEVIPIGNYDAVAQQLQQIERELTEKPFQYLTSVQARISLILVEINRAKIDNGDEIWKPSALLLRFLEFVRNNFEQNYSLAEIAARLHTTELKLNEQAKLHAGKTAQNVIYGLIISEAKRLIQYENLLFKEVAARVGFDDPFYFSKFFRHHTGFSPSSFQKNIGS